MKAGRSCFKEGALAGRQVDEAQLAYTQAESQFRDAQEHLKTLESVSKEEQIKGAAAQVQSAKAHFDSQDAQVAYSHIVSPISGIVADRPLNAGEMANPGSPVITVMDITRVVARIDVPQAEASSVKSGTKRDAHARPDSTEEVEGKVTVVSPAADPNTTTVQVWIQIDNPGERLKPGTAVHAAIATEVFKAATVVPVAAILPGEEGGTAILTVSSDSVAHKRAVTLGVREGGQVQILSGAESRRRGGGGGRHGPGRQDQGEGRDHGRGRIRSTTTATRSAGAGKDQKGAPKKDPGEAVEK